MVFITNQYNHVHHSWLIIIDPFHSLSDCNNFLVNKNFRSLSLQNIFSKHLTLFIFSLYDRFLSCGIAGSKAKTHFNIFFDYFLKCISNSLSPAMYENASFPAPLAKYIWKLNMSLSYQISFENCLWKLSLTEVE